MLVSVIETMKRVLGEEHLDTLTSIANLASIYKDQGRWKEAEELEMQVKGCSSPSTLFIVFITYISSSSASF
jgi:uncharacterized protein involved in tolerance to divalent cations